MRGTGVEYPFVLDGVEEHFVRIRSRHNSYPVSGAKRRHTAVGATFESGKGFIAEVELMT